MEDDKYLEINLDANFLRQNKTALLLAALILVGLMLVTASKFYNAGKTKQAATITKEAASTSTPAAEVTPLESSPSEELMNKTKPKTISYEVKAGDYLEKIIADVCGEVGGTVTTNLRNRDRLAIGQLLQVSCN